MQGRPNWARFWSVLRQTGAAALSRLPDEWAGLVDAKAADTDDFWSQQLVDRFEFEWRQAETPADAVYAVLLEYADNVRGELADAAEDGELDHLSPTSDQRLVARLGEAMQP